MDSFVRDTKRSEKSERYSNKAEGLSTIEKQRHSFGTVIPGSGLERHSVTRGVCPTHVTDGNKEKVIVGEFGLKLQKGALFPTIAEAVPPSLKVIKRETAMVAGLARGSELQSGVVSDQHPTHRIIRSPTRRKVDT